MEYEFPPHVKVSKECRDLLHKILVPDPAKRITVPEIQNHVWYKKDLPPGVSDMNDNLPPPGAGLQVCFTHSLMFDSVSPSLTHSLIHSLTPSHPPLNVSLSHTCQSVSKCLQPQLFVTRSACTIELQCCMFCCCLPCRGLSKEQSCFVYSGCLCAFVCALL